MLGNNEQINGVDLGEVFTQMIGELPWNSLLQYIQANSQLQKLCTIGGHRLVPDKRKRFEDIIIKDARKQQFTDAVTNGVFASWYPVHTELHKQLEDYYHSDEYKAYREANGLGEEEYVLSDEKLDSFYKVTDLKLWKILLCFSPLKFTKEQAGKLLDNQTGNEELVTNLKNLQTSNADLTRKNEQLTAEAVRLRAKQNEDAAELQELKKQVRQLRQEAEQNQRRLDSAQSEAKRASQQMAQADTQRQDAENAIKAEMARNQKRLQDELDRVNKELQGWQARYEEQRALCRKQEEQLDAVDKEKTELASAGESAKGQLDALNSFADLILSHIDWPKVGSAMKLNPTMRRNFNSLVRKLDYEEDRTQTIEGTLQDFWKRLSACEDKLVAALANSNTEEVATGNIADYWEGLKPSFAEVQNSLEARIVLLGMLKDIFYQTLDMEDLENSALAKAKTKKKSE